MVTYRN